MKGAIERFNALPWYGKILSIPGLIICGFLFFLVLPVLLLISCGFLFLLMLPALLLSYIVGFTAKVLDFAPEDTYDPPI